MKSNLLKTAVMAMISVFIFVAIPQNAFAQASKKNTKQEEKQGNKNFKEKVKELEDGKWKIAGDYRTLELALIEHQNKVDGNPEKYGTAVGEASKCRSIDACKQMVQFQAQRQLTEELSAEVQAVATQAANLNIMSGDEANNITNNATRYAQADVSGILLPSYSLIKANEDGTNSFRTVYIVDLQKKSAVQESALQKALKETKLTIEQADKVQEFVKKAFEEKKSLEE
jgi:hypothetical protein